MRIILLSNIMLLLCSISSFSQKIINLGACDSLSKIETLECKRIKLDSIDLLIEKKIQSLYNKFGNKNEFDLSQKSWLKYRERSCQLYVDVLAGSNQSQILYYNHMLLFSQRRLEELSVYDGIE